MPLGLASIHEMREKLIDFITSGYHQSKLNFDAIDKFNENNMKSIKRKYISQVRKDKNKLVHQNYQKRDIFSNTLQ